MRSPILLILAVCLSGFANVAAAQDVYFSVGPEIRKMTLPNTTSRSVYTSTAFVGDLALCSDNNLYFVEKAPLNRVRSGVCYQPDQAAGDDERIHSGQVQTVLRQPNVGT